MERKKSGNGREDEHVLEALLQHDLGV